MLCRGVAPPEGRQTKAGKALVVVGFLQIVRPALQDGRQSQIQCVSMGEVRGNALGSTVF